MAKFNAFMALKRKYSLSYSKMLDITTSTPVSFHIMLLRRAVLYCARLPVDVTMNLIFLVSVYVTM